MSQRVRRLLEMPGRELSFRTRALVRTHTERLRVALAPPVWTRRGLARVLEPRVVDAPLRAALAAERWADAGHLLRDAFLRRANRFVIDPREARLMSRAIDERYPEASANAAQSGDVILAGKHCVLGYPAVSFAHSGGPIDWHLDPVHQRRAPMRFWADVPFLDPASGDHKIIWEINRHQYFVALGRAYWLTRDRRYAARIVRDVHGWLGANPPLVGINWASMLELGFRSLSWVAATHFLLADVTDPERAASEEGGFDDSWLLDILGGLDRQLTHVEGHLSRYFSPNTHLTGEALALYVVGVALPELAGSERWARLGKEILLDEISGQINRDGGHAELSTCYHRYTLDFYSLAAITAELEGDGSSAARFREAVDRLREYMVAFTGADGLIPMIGDDDGGKLWGLSDRDPRDVRDSLALAALVSDSAERPADAGIDGQSFPEEALWLAWSVRPAVRRLRPAEIRREASRPASLRVHQLPDSGYVIAHSRHGDQLTFDVGHHGFRNGGHAHADALSITLTLEGAPLLIDPGTATYTMDPALRNRLRDTAAHNTVTLDERPSAIPRGTFQWDTRAAARLTVLRRNPHFVIAEGTHDGYAPAAHIRTIFHSDDAGWLIADVIDGHSGMVDLHWHFDPQWHVETAAPRALLATGPTGARAWLLHDGGVTTLACGEETRGWCSPRYGALVPTFAARIRHQSNTVPLTTWIGTADDDVAPTLARVPLEAPSRALAYRITHRHGTTLTVLHPGNAKEPHVATCGDVASDSRAVQITTRHDGALTMALAEGHQVRAAALHALEMTCTEQIDDLYVSIHEGVAELWSTAPPAGLQLRFTDGWLPRRLRLNGRDTVGLSRGAWIDIPASAWGATPFDPARAPMRMDATPHPDAAAGRRLDATRSVASEGRS